MRSLSFDDIAEFYDETRVLDENCLNSALDYIVDRFFPDKFGNIFYPGIGTGRIAIPLAERGYRITGIDISNEMLAFLRNRLTQVRQFLPISYCKADTTKVPFASATFDMGIAVHLFYFISEWQQALKEILRVVKRNHPIVLIHTGSGAEIPFLNTRYKELCAELGCPIQEVGVSSTREVVDYLKNLGCEVEWIRDKWQWTSLIRLDKALDYMKSRTYSFTTFAPIHIHSRALEKLESELQQQFGSLTTEVKIPNQIYLVIILQPG